MRKQTRAAIAACIAASLIGSIALRSAISQATPVQGTAVVRGLAFDSLRAVPLGGAYVAIRGTGRHAISDSLGRFRLDSVPRGSWLLTMEHAAVESLGIAGITAKLNVGEAEAEIVVAIPSFATFWRAACGTSVTPKDSSLVFGSVRDARTNDPVGSAKINVSWVDSRVAAKTKSVSQVTMTVETTADASGGFAVCGVPSDMGLRIVAFTDSTASGVINLLPQDTRVLRRDLTLGSRMAAIDSSNVGTITGLLTDELGAVVKDARVSTDYGKEAMSATDGRYTMSGVLAGTRELTIIAMGKTALKRTVDVPANGVVIVDAQLARVTMLESVSVTAAEARRVLLRDFEERKKLGLARIMDSTAIGNARSMVSVLRSFPGVVVVQSGSRIVTIKIRERGYAGSEACLFIDGLRAELDDLYFARPEDIAAIEVYMSAFSVPPQFTIPRKLCPTIVIWTKWKLGRV